MYAISKTQINIHGDDNVIIIIAIITSSAALQHQGRLRLLPPHCIWQHPDDKLMIETKHWYITF